jgi:hypothetical protein
MGENPKKIAELVIDGDSHEWTKENSMIKGEIEKCPHGILMIEGLSEDGKFDYTNPKHAALLPIMYRSPYLYCQKEA